MTDFGDCAPNFDLTVNGKSISAGVRALIETVDYESADGMADALHLNITNIADDQGRFPVSDSRLFAPGNELSLFIGYGTSLTHIGRAIIRKVRNAFPRGAIPTIEVVGYSKDAVMNDTRPDPLKEKKKSKKGKVLGLKNSKAGRRYKDAKYSDAVEQRAQDYGMETDVDPTPDAPHDFIQRARMSDFEFITGLANLTGYYFWVDGDEDGIWTLHFKDPEKLKQSDIQSKEYIFKYNDGDFSTLLSFEPELAIQQTITKLLIEAKNPLTGEVMEAKIDEEDDEDGGPDPEAEGGGDLSPQGNELELDWKSGSSVKVYVGEFSFDIRTELRFRTPAELAAWASQWFRRMKENFIMGSGDLIGVENLRARQIHNFTGLGLAYDGKYQFTRVKHTFSPSAGYFCNFSARKIVGAPPSPAITATIQQIPVNF